MSELIHLSESVAAALYEHRPVVALETAVVTHGLPRTPPRELPNLAGLDAGFDWSTELPLNLQCAQMLSHVVLKSGVTPAVVSVLDGQLRIGLEEDDLLRLACDESAEKASTANLATLLASRCRAAGATVSATLIACERALPHPIRVFATGGIGGVHRGWTERPDISADLPQLARSRVCVVCSGGKSILDLPATMEAMETLGIGVAGYQTDRMPGFYVRATDIHMSSRVDSAAEAAAICRARWGGLDQPGGMVIAQPVPEQFAIDEAEIEEATRRAEIDADEAAITGGARTPFLLSRLVELTQGRSLRANLALLAANASLAAEISTAMAENGGGGADH